MIPVEIDCYSSQTPTKAHGSDACFDLRAAEDLRVPAGGRKLVDVGIALNIPDGWAAMIWPRSGLAVKQGIDTGAGVIDAGYNGPVKVLLFNHSEFDFDIKEGDRIAQLQFVAVPQVEFWLVDEFSYDTDRGTGGFGSTGV